jgi:hypothetical protein
MDTEIDEQVKDWFQSRMAETIRENAKFEQWVFDEDKGNWYFDDDEEEPVYDEDKGNWYKVYTDDSVRQRKPELYQHYLDRIEREIDWPLYDFQKEDVARMLCKKNGIYAGFAGMGKAQPLDSKVLTPTGWTEMGEIEVGDKVIGKGGDPIPVIGVFPQGEKEVYEVSFSDGSSVRCCKEHLWNVQSSAQKSASGRFSTKSLEEIMEMGIRDKNGKKSKFVPTVDPVNFKEKGSDLDIDPYVLGALLGDGCIRQKSCVFSCKSDFLLDEIRELTGESIQLKPKSDNSCDYRLSRYNEYRGYGKKNYIVSSLREMGLTGKGASSKFVPEQYKFSSPEIRLFVLQGLMDTDGNATAHYGRFTTVSEQLSDDVAFIARSLGGTAKIDSRTTSFTYDGEKKEGQTSYRVTVKLPEQLNMFRMPRKRSVVESHRSKDGTNNDPTKSIEKIEKVGSEKCQCIQVFSNDGLYVTNGFTVTHNTRSYLSYIYLRGGDKNLVVLKSNLIRELKREIEIIGFPKHWLHVIEDPEDARPARLNRLNVISYSRIWRPVNDKKRLDREPKTVVHYYTQKNNLRQKTLDGHKSRSYIISNTNIKNVDHIEHTHDETVKGPQKTTAHRLRETRFNTVVFDEAHSLKGGLSTKQAKFSKLLRCKHTIESTATVIKNYPRDIYSPMQQAFGDNTTENRWGYTHDLIDDESDKHRFNSASKIFRSKFVQVGWSTEEFEEDLQSGMKGKEIPKVPDDHIDEWREMVSTKVVRRNRYEPMVLKDIPQPDADYRDIDFDISKEHARFYQWWLEEFEEFFVEQLAEEEDGNGFESAKMLALLNKLRFAATVPQADNLHTEELQKRGAPEWNHGLTTKQEGILEDTIEKVESGTKALLFSERPDFLILMNDEFRSRGINSLLFTGRQNISPRLDNLDSFREDPEQKVLLMSRQCGQMGYNLEIAGITWSADYSWVPSKMTQAEGRMLRPAWPMVHGEDATPLICRGVQSGTIDEYMRQQVEMKNEGIGEAIDHGVADIDPSDFMDHREFAEKMLLDLGLL